MKDKCTIFFAESVDKYAGLYNFISDKWILFEDGVIGKVIKFKPGWIKVKYTAQNSGRWYEIDEVKEILTNRLKCSYAAKYKGIRQPKCGCIECWDIYMRDILINLEE